MTEITTGQVRRLYAKTGGRAWEPPDPNEPACQALVDGGWVVRVDGRCGYEMIRDAMLKWTDAAHAAFRSPAADR